MNKAFEKILERLEDTKDIAHDDSVAEVISTRIWNKAIHIAKQIVQEVAEEYNSQYFMRELIKAKEYCSEDSDCSECIFGQDKDICHLQELQILGGNNGWIPCSERLPEESGEYLTWVEYDGNRFRAIDEIDCDGIIKKWNCSTDYKIIAWRPLPEPYKENK